MSDNADIYGNFAYQKSRWVDTGFLQATNLVDNGDGTTAVPAFTWSLGLNYDFSDRMKLNVQYRGWDKMAFVTSSSRQDFLTYVEPKTIDMRGPEHYVTPACAYPSR